MKIGLNVKASVCDQGAPNRKMFKNLGVTVNKPFINLNGMKIYALFDWVHLLKTFSNTHKKHDILFGEKGEKISWNTLVQLYREDSQGIVRACPKLTETHFFPGPFDLIIVKLATQVYSNDVSTALLTLSNLINSSSTISKKEARSLRTFIKKMNDLFDCMNSRTIRNPNPLRRPLSRKIMKLNKH